MKRLVLLALSFFFTVSLAIADDAVRTGCRRGRQDAQLVAKKRVRKMSTSLDSMQYRGTRHQLVVLASFADKRFQQEDPTDFWNQLLNEGHFNSDSPYQGSLADYFNAQSYGRFEIVSDIIYVQLDSLGSRYESTRLDDENSQFLVYDIMDKLKSQDIDWELYDWNGNGEMNQLLIIFPGLGMNDGGGTGTIWAHQWWLSEHFNPSTHEKCQPCKVTDNQGKSYIIDCYCAIPEQGKQGSSFGTLCHEFSHCFGLPDFYYGSTSYIGSWDLMDRGNYNANGYVPCNYSAQERMFMGWLQPVELTQKTAVSGMACLSDAPEAYLIRNDGCESEYYLLENRQQEGWDKAIPGSGLLIFHINFDINEWISVNQSPNHSGYYRDGVSYPSQKHYYIIPANNLQYDRADWAYPYGDNNQLTSSSSPADTLFNANIDGTLHMNKPVTNIAVEDGKISFDFMDSDVSTVKSAVVSSECTLLYEFGNICIVRCPDGSTRKVLREVRH